MANWADEFDAQKKHKNEGHGYQYFLQHLPTHRMDYSDKYCDDIYEYRCPYKSMSSDAFVGVLASMCKAPQFKNSPVPSMKI